MFKLLNPEKETAKVKFRFDQLCSVSYVCSMLAPEKKQRINAVKLGSDGTSSSQSSESSNSHIRNMELVYIYINTNTYDTICIKHCFAETRFFALFGNSPSSRCF